jgi:hypothetical protein
MLIGGAPRTPFSFGRVAACANREAHDGGRPLLRKEFSSMPASKQVADQHTRASIRMKNGCQQLNGVAASALTGLDERTLSRYLHDGKFKGEIETSEGRKREWYDKEFLKTWRERKTADLDLKGKLPEQQAGSSRMKKGRRQLNGTAASALTDLFQFDAPQIAQRRGNQRRI